MLYCDVFVMLKRKKTFIHFEFLLQHGDTPLHVAVRYNNYQVAKMLRKEGAKVDKVNKVCIYDKIASSLNSFCYKVRLSLGLVFFAKV